MRLTLKEIKNICHVAGSELSDSVVIECISTDTRTISSGSLYVALQGHNFDGHQFIEDAFNKGAVACLVSKEIPEKYKNKCMQVADTLKSLGDIACAWRKKFSIPTIVITGSAGKTTTKEFVAAILAQKGVVCKTQGNFNNLIGLPLTLFGLNESHNFAVLEIGMNAFGEIDRLTEIATPTIALITNVGRAHLEGVGSLDGVAKAKGELFLKLEQTSTALVNLDDPNIKKMPTPATRVTYGFNDEATIQGEKPVFDDESMLVSVRTPKWQHKFRLPFVGDYLAKNFLAAVSVAFLLDIEPEKIQIAMDHLDFFKHRGEKVVLKNDILLIDDCYNANPEAMSAAFEAFGKRFPNRRKIAILGDIFELGLESNKLHQEVGELASKNNFDALFAVGERASFYVKGFTLTEKKEAYAFAEIADMSEKLNSFLKPGDALLVKGSRGARMERVIEFLEKEEA